MFYVELTRGGRAEICGEGAVHLRKVLRAERGQRYEVSDNETLYLAEIADISKDRVEFELVERIEAPVLPVRLHLLAALVKFDRFEWIIEKATELGVDAITPVVAARSEHGLEDGARKRSDRWRKILFESGQQSRRVTRPELNAVTDLTVALGADGDAKLWMDEQRSGPAVLSVLPPIRDTGDRVCVMTGPEGGWENEERESAVRSGWLPVSLGPQILRAETAAIAGLAIVSAGWQVKAAGVAG